MADVAEDRGTVESAVSDMLFICERLMSEYEDLAMEAGNICVSDANMSDDEELAAVLLGDFDEWLDESFASVTIMDREFRPSEIVNADEDVYSDMKRTWVEEQADVDIEDFSARMWGKINAVHDAIQSVQDHVENMSNQLENQEG